MKSSKRGTRTVGSGWFLVKAKKLQAVVAVLSPRLWGPRKPELWALVVMNDEDGGGDEAPGQGTKPPATLPWYDDLDWAWTEAHLDEDARNRSDEMWRRLSEE